MKWDARPLVVAALGALLTATSARAQSAPVASGQNLVTSVDTATAVTLKADDADGDSLTYHLVRWPAYGTFTGTPPDLIYQPEPNFNGRDNFTFKATDGSADSNTATVKILVNDAPAGTVQINMGKDTELMTRRTSVLLALTVTDDGPGPILMCISNKATCSYWMPFAGKKKWRLARGNGNKTVSVWFRDKWRQKSSPVSDTILLDRKAPTGGQVTAVPGDAKVTLNWDGFTDGAGSGIAGYRAVFKRGGTAPLSCNDGTPVPDYAGTAKTLEHTVLANGEPLVNGTNYAYRVCAIDAVGNISAGATATGKPVPDTTAPTGTVTINGGAVATNSTLATLTLTAADDGGGTIEMCISNTATCSSWTSFEATPSWTLAGGSGTMTVNVWFRDRRGNTSATPNSDTIIVDTTPPTGTVTINGDAAATNSTLATLTLTAADDGGGTIEMCISNTATCSSWTSFEATPSWTLAVGNGIATVNVWYRDQLENTSATPSSDTILVDTTAPTDGTVAATPGDTQLTLNWSGFTDPAGSGIAGYRPVFQLGGTPASCDSGTPVPGYAGTATTVVHTGLVNGTTYGYRVCAIDAVGNRSSGATVSGVMVMTNCESCHGKDGYVHPGINDGAGDDAPNVMTYWDGSWWDSNKGGNNAVQQGGHGDPDHFPARQCVDCHDITLPPGTHLDGVYNSIWGDGSGTRNQNTAHLKASFIGGTTPSWSVQLTLDAACWGCHQTVGGIVDWRHPNDDDPAPGAVQFGSHLTEFNGDTLPLPDPNDFSWPGPYPVDQDISTNASGSTYYAPCISCHDPHGTGAPARETSNFMMRDRWSPNGSNLPSTLCRVCHL